MRQILRYYYDPECNVIKPDDVELDEKCGNEAFHNIIAERIINKNPEFLKEYNEISKNGVIATTIFLVMKGYIYIGGQKDGDMSTMYSSISLNDKTRELMYELKQDGYYAYDVIRDALDNNQIAQIKNWAKEGMPRNKIVNNVMKDMIVQLSPQKRENKDDFER